MNRRSLAGLAGHGLPGLHRSLHVLLGLALAVAGLASTARAQVAVPFSTTVPFTSTADVASFVVDLTTLPDRPDLIVYAVPTGLSQDPQIQIEITEVQISSFGGTQVCPDSTSAPIRNVLSPGTAQLVWNVWRCDPLVNAEPNQTARVSVRIADFGTSGAPANVVIAMRGVTSPATNTHQTPYWAPNVQHTITLRPTKDTTIYQRAPTTSNGAGEFLWVGRDVGGGAFSIRSLLSFPLRGGPIPTNATLNNVTLRLDVESIVGTGNSLRVWSSGFNVPWDEGIADATGDEFQGAASILSSATWNVAKTVPNVEWGGGGSSGGDPGSQLFSQSVTTTGVKSLSSTLLRNAVQQLITNTGTLFQPDGLVLLGPETSVASSGLQLASRESTAAGATPPELVVTFTIPGAPQEATPPTGVVHFLDEGQNLRWIYDTDNDNVLSTPVGICTASPDPFDNDFAPYSYAFTGAPGFTGLDCCAYQIQSIDTGLVGTGQLIFYHNLDSQNPANRPPDTDRDGIANLCDNCPLKANGPLLGSCISGPRLNLPCRSNPDCVTGTCSLSQEDANFDRTGDACVPEPGTSAMLVAGALALAGLARRR